MARIYADNAATTKMSEAAKNTLLRCLEEGWANPSSLHTPGQIAAERLRQARQTIAACLNARPEEILFTSGGSEADNQALISLAAAGAKKEHRHIVSSRFEHHAVLHTLDRLKKQGFEVTLLDVHQDGVVRPEELKAALRPDTVLVSMMLVNNETGALQPVAQAAQLLRRKQSAALLHTDAVQGFLKIPFTPKGLGVDLLTISGHKIGAMKGSGALYLRKGLRAVPLIRGGGQERGLRSGTEATPQIAALAAAASLGRERMEEHTAALTDLKAYALETFQRGVPGLAVVSPGDAPHICAISLPGYPSQVVVRWLSDRGFCVSSGSACHRGKASHVYAAMHLSKGVRDGVLRISFGPENTRQEVDQLAQALLEATRDLVPARG